MQKPREWSPEEDAIATRMRQGGSSLQEIGDALGRTRSSVNGRLRDRPRQSTLPEKNPTSAENKRLKSERDNLAKALETARKPRVKLPVKYPKKQKGDYIRLAVPDTHGSKADRAALSAMLADAKVLKPREVVMLGDHADCGGFLAQHHTMGYVSETAYTFEDDAGAANQLLDDLQVRCPDADFHYLDGNHERRIEAWIVNQTLRNQADASYLRKMFSVESVLSLQKRGINHYQQGRFYHGLSIPATIKLGHCHFTHGSRAGVHAAMQTLSDFGGNVVYAHTHRADSASKRTVNDGLIYAWNPGCLCQLQPLWQHTQITGWSHGYGVQLVRSNGDFLHINVPIIDGQSYLVGLTGIGA